MPDAKGNLISSPLPESIVDSGGRSGTGAG